MVATAMCAVLLVPVLATGATPPQEPKPVNTGVPKLTGTPVVGQTLTCSTGSWANNPTGYSYVWLRSDSPIPGQTGITYVVQSADQGHSISCLLTASNSGGEYTIGGLPSGSYEVSFFAGEGSGNYMTQYFNGQSFQSEANRISVTDGSVTAGINAAMPAGGEITGRVTNAATHGGVAGVGACAETEGRQEGCVVTNATGEYTIGGLPSGSYSIWFTEDSEYRGGWSWYGYYNNKSSRGEANLVSVTAGSVTSGINTEMQTGQISGKVTNASGTMALEDIEACAWSAGGGGPSAGSPTKGCTLTNGSGEYTIKGLAVGSYEVEFSAFVCGPKACEQRQNYLNQYYDEKTSDSQAELVSVTAGNTTPTIDAKMAEGGQIAGRVTSAATHSPQAGIHVCPQANEQNNGSGNCVETNTAGEYMISGLTAGSYNVTFSSGWEGPNYLPQYFNGKSISSEATAVPVSAGHVSAGVNAELQAGGEITGRVTSAATHAGLAKISVCAEHSVNTPESCVHTNAAGEYTITGLSGGSPRVLFSKGESGGNYAAQFFDGQSSLASASAVSVATGSVTSGIDAEMLAAGEVTGRVTSAVGAGALGGIRVCAFRTSGESLFPGEGEECAVTDSGGGSASATSNALVVPDNNFTMTKAPRFDAKTGDLDFYFKFASAGTVRWNLSFKNADVGFADSLGLSCNNSGFVTEAAKRKSKRCKASYVKHKGKCVRTLVPFSSGSKSVPASTVELEVHAGHKALEALKAGHTLHVSGPFRFQSTLGGAPVTHTVSTVVHWYKLSKKTHGKKGGRHQSS